MGLNYMGYMTNTSKWCTLEMELIVFQPSFVIIKATKQIGVHDKPSLRKSCKAIRRAKKLWKIKFI